MSISLFLRVICTLATLSFACAAGAAARDSSTLARQREQFPAVWEIAKHGPDDAWRKLAPGLEDYPLFPYLELAGLRRRIGQVKRTEVDRFLAKWPDTLPARMLREDFALELARRKDWKTVLAFDAGSARTPELQCDVLQARIALGQPPEFARDVEPLWLSGGSLPDACDPVMHWARERGKLTDALVWRRIDLAAQAGNSSLVRALAPLLDAGERPAAERIALAVADPGKLLDEAAHLGDGARAREAVTVAFTRLARRDSDRAETLWAKLEAQYRLSAEQRARVLRALAVYRATSFAPDAAARLAALPDGADDDTTREWRVRVALASADYAATLKALDALSAEQQRDPRWRYLRARVLVKLDREAAAMPLLGSLAQEANFYGFLAADWLAQPYTICAAPAPSQQGADPSLDEQPDLARAFEFFALDRLPDARREWDFAQSRLTPAQRRLAAERASAAGWFDRAVYAFNHGDDLHLYTLRFPLAHRDQVVRAARAAGVDPAWAYAIIRAESAWTTDAHSGADAWGLMQLLPGTASHLAKALKLRFGGTRDLLDPDTNITLGTRYLGRMAEHYDGSPWLASAAYNAGADPVGRWIGDRDQLEPDFFIETIPYRETREYVARVLAFSVIYDWRLHGTVLPLSSRLPRVGQAYAAPDDDAPRKQVVCPATRDAERATAARE